MRIFFQPLQNKLAVFFCKKMFEYCSTISHQNQVYDFLNGVIYLIWIQFEIEKKKIVRLARAKKLSRKER